MKILFYYLIIEDVIYSCFKFNYSLLFLIDYLFLLILELFFLHNSNLNNFQLNLFKFSHWLSCTVKEIALHRDHQLNFILFMNFLKNTKKIIILFID